MLKQAFPSTKMVFYGGDPTGAAAVDKLFVDVVKDFGKIDILDNTVEMVLKKPVTEISEEVYDKMFAVNSKSVFFIMKAGATNVQPGGKVIISTVTALLSAFTRYYTTYADSKASVDYFTRGVSKDLANKQISVNAIVPVLMDTPFLYGQETPETVTFFKSQALERLLTDVKDIAPIVKFLCTEGQWITGQTIFGNGGLSTRCNGGFLEAWSEILAPFWQNPDL